jgi:hypothetical protein
VVRKVVDFGFSEKSEKIKNDTVFSNSYRSVRQIKKNIRILVYYGFFPGYCIANETGAISERRKRNPSKAEAKHLSKLYVNERNCAKNKKNNSH